MADSGRRPVAPPEPKVEERSGFGRKILGLFVEESKSVDEVSEVAEEPGSAAAQVAAIARSTAPTPAAAPPSPSPTTTSGGRPAAPGSYKTPDYAGIFKSGGLTDEERDRLGKAEELLRNLPAETPEALKRQIVEGTLRAFNIPVESLTKAAQKATDTLDTYLNISSQDLRTRIDAAEKRLVELRAEQEKLQQSIVDRRMLQDTLTFDVHSRQVELRSVVAFFGKPAGAK